MLRGLIHEACLKCSGLLASWSREHWFICLITLPVVYRKVFIGSIRHFKSNQTHVNYPVIDAVNVVIVLELYYNAVYMIWVL